MSKRRWKLALDPRAEREARAAFLWYEERNPAAADEFRRSFDRAVRDVEQAPLRWPEIEPGVRRRLLGGFPYGLLYAIEREVIVVLAVMHQRRRPGYWK